MDRRLVKWKGASWGSDVLNQMQPPHALEAIHRVSETATFSSTPLGSRYFKNKGPRKNLGDPGGLENIGARGESCGGGVGARRGMWRQSVSQNRTMAEVAQDRCGGIDAGQGDGREEGGSGG